MGTDSHLRIHKDRLPKEKTKVGWVSGRLIGEGGQGQEILRYGWNDMWEGDEDGSPHARGHGMEEDWSWGTIGSSLRCAMFRMTWGSAELGITGGCCSRSDVWVEGEDHPHPPSSRGQALTFPLKEGREKEGMGFRMREDTGW